MAVTVSGTSITFNDATVQTTAAGAPTTAQVLTATAGASAGSVGSYMWGYRNAVILAFGATTAGSSITPGGGTTTPCAGIIIFGTSGAAQAGTWRCMGYNSGQANATGTVFLRIS
jgi:hypothetical protein